MGIADSVTVLARTGAVADAAATLIANAVDVDDPAIRREPAAELAPDSDLGDRLVTVEVGPLPPRKGRARLGPRRRARERHAAARADRRRPARAPGPRAHTRWGAKRSNGERLTLGLRSAGQRGSARRWCPAEERGRAASPRPAPARTFRGAPAVSYSSAPATTAPSRRGDHASQGAQISARGRDHGA